MFLSSGKIRQDIDDVYLLFHQQGLRRLCLFLTLNFAHVA